MMYAILGLPTEKLTGAFSGFSASGLFQAFTILAMIIAIALIGGAVAYFFIQGKRYKYHITLVEDIAGRSPQLAGRDRAMLLKIGSTGEEVLRFKKAKVFRTAYGRKIGTNHYLFVRGSDGFWYNAVWKDFDITLQELGLDPVDENIRVMYSGIRRNTEKRFESQNWLKDNIGMVVGFVVIIFILVFMWLIADKFFSITGAAESATKASAAAVEKVDHLLSTMSTICPTGSGLR